MRIDETQKMINDYFGVMGAHGDFSQFYAEDVTWIMIDAGVETRGAAAVRDYVVALHGQMTDVHTHRICGLRRGGVSRRRLHQRADDRRTPHCLLRRLRPRRQSNHRDAVLRNVRRNGQSNPAS
jgi:hypothetical protein